MVDIERNHGYPEPKSKTFVVEVAIVVYESPEYRQVNVRGHVVPEPSCFRNTIPTRPSQLRPLDVVSNCRVAQDKWQGYHYLEANYHNDAADQLYCAVVVLNLAK